MDFDFVPANDPSTNTPADQQQPQNDFQFMSDAIGESGPSGGFEAMNSIPLTGNPMESMNSMPMGQEPSEPLDEEEQKRIEARKQEEDERRKKIEEKINYELRQKEEIKDQARKYMEEYETKRAAALNKRKEQNIANEKEFINNKKLIKEGKKNPWEIVTDNIALKESDYKGSNDVSRMRAVIIARKNDQSQEKGKNEVGLENIL